MLMTTDIQIFMSAINEMIYCLHSYFGPKHFFLLKLNFCEKIREAVNKAE